jgi:hypothetical protein
MYEPNYYGHKGTVYMNPNDNPTFSGTQSDLNDAKYFVVTGKSYKEAGISLISDADFTGNVRGWSIAKTATTAELVFTFTNNDPGVGTPACGPYNVMQLNGFNNRVEFPLATGTLPTNETAKLMWGGEANTNLYRPTGTPNTLKTDANFIVGGALTAGSTFISTLTVGAGTPANPSLQFAGSTNTGFSAQTPNRLSFDTNALERMSISPTGTVSINEFTIAGVVHNNASGQLSSSLIIDADIATNAAIVDTKLATISTAGKVLDSATTATSNNIFDTIVKRDTSGDFAATMITASLTGMVTGTASFNVLKIGDTMTGNLTLPAGTAAAPSLNFTGGTTTGLSMPSADYLSFDTAGVERMSIESTGTVNILGTLVLAAGTAAEPSLKFTNGTNTGFSSATANQLSFDINGVERMNIDSTDVTITATLVSAAPLIMRNVNANQAVQSLVDAVTTVTINNATSVIIKNYSSAQTLDVTFPVSPIDGQIVTIIAAATGNFNLTINTFNANFLTFRGTVTPLNPNNTFNSTANGTAVSYIYSAATNTWYKYWRG